MRPVVHHVWSVIVAATLSASMLQPAPIRADPPHPNARPAARRVIDLEPLVRARASGDNDAIIAAARQLAASLRFQPGPEAAEARVHAAEELQSHGAEDDALALAEESIAVPPPLGFDSQSYLYRTTWQRALIVRALVYEHRGRLYDALTDAERARNLQPALPYWHIQRAGLHLIMRVGYRLGETIRARSAALEDLRIAVFARNEPVIDTIVDTMLAAHDEDGIPSAMTELHRRSTGNAHIHTVFTRLQFELAIVQAGRGELRDAEEGLRRVRDSLPDSGREWIAAALVRLALQYEPLVVRAEQFAMCAGSAADSEATIVQAQIGSALLRLRRQIVLFGDANALALARVREAAVHEALAASLERGMTACVATGPRIDPRAVALESRADVLETRDPAAADRLRVEAMVVRERAGSQGTVPAAGPATVQQLARMEHRCAVDGIASAIGMFGDPAQWAISIPLPLSPPISRWVLRAVTDWQIANRRN